MTHFLQYILRQPDKLRGVIQLLRGGDASRSRLLLTRFGLPVMSTSPASGPAEHVSDRRET